MRIHHHNVADALASLQSKPEGLSPAEAKRRLLEYGPNTVEAVRGPSMRLRFVRSFGHFFAVILWIAAALAFVAEFQNPGEGMALLGIAIVGVILVNGLFSFWQEYRAERALESLQSLLPQESDVLRDGSVRCVPAAELVPGDVILLEEGDNVPADCRLIEAFGVKVNTATITGESLSQSRAADPHYAENFATSTNVLLAGTSLSEGQAKAIVFATGGHTVFGQIARLAQAAREPLSPLQVEIVRLSRVIAVFTLVLGATFFLIGRFVGLPFWVNFVFAIGIIVANVPEGLLPTVTLALAMGSQRMARRNALIRHLPAVEALGSATVICTDKTGTLTLNRMEVTRIYTGGQLLSSADAAAWHIPSHLVEIARSCHNLKQKQKNGSSELVGDATEIALFHIAGETRSQAVEYPRIDEVVFTPQRRRLSTVHRTSQGFRIYTKGAAESVLRCCSRTATAHGTEKLQDTQRKQAIDAEELLAKDGLRVIALAYRDIHEDAVPDEVESDMIFSGLVGLQDPPRPEAKEAVRRCHEAGIKVVMITGDHPLTAEAIAREIGLARSPVIITGDQLEHYSTIQLQLALDAPELLFARVGPAQKLEIVSAFKRKGHVVAVTGDGVNDAPALKHADVGIAMGRSGTDVARQTADMILLDDNFATIVAAIEEGRSIFANIRKFLTYVLSSNVAELVPYLVFVLFKVPLLLTIIQILVVDFGTDLVPAIGLGAERPHPDLMKRPPRQRHERLLDWRILLRSYGWLGAMEAAAAMLASIFVLHSNGWHYGETLESKNPIYLQATTASLAAIILTQTANVFLCRSEHISSFNFSLRSNPLILWGVAIELCVIILISYTHAGNLLFGTAPLPIAVWFIIVAAALLMFVMEELRKVLARSRPRHSGVTQREHLCA